MDKFENIIKQAVEGYEAPFNPQAWENVSKDLGDSFDQAIKDSAGKYEAPYSPAAWEAVSSQLGPAYAAWKWVAGAAAVVAAVVGTVYITNQGGESDTNQANNNGNSSELAVNTVDNNENNDISDNNNLVVSDDNLSEETNDEITNGVNNAADQTNDVAVDDNSIVDGSNGSSSDDDNTNDQSNNNDNSNVLNDNGNVNSHNDLGDEKDYDANADFNISNSEICSGEKCNFTPTQPNSELIYVWNFGDGKISSEIAAEHKYTREGNFTITLEVKHPKTNKTLATSRNSITVNALPKTDFTWEQTDAVIPVVNFINLTDEATKWNWNIRGLKQSTQNDFEYTFRKAGQYVIDLTATNEFACVKKVQKTIKIEKDYNLLAPTAFSPNGDFKNDVFIPKALQIMDGVEFTMNIMSKSGERVYTTRNVNQPWDGVNMNDNTQMPAGSAYVWQVVLINSNGERELYEGQVIIIR